MPRFFRKIIRITAEDSPNVRRALRYQRAGLIPPGEVVLPGVLPWDEYCKRRALWDDVRQCIGLDAQFYLGAETLLYPPQWLNRAEQLARSLEGRPRRAEAIGIDPGEGSANTAMCAVDRLGLIELVSRQTPDTTAITAEAIAFLRRHNVPAEQVLLDRGGGGKQHADRLRSQGYPVRTVAFGETVSLEPRRGVRQLTERLEHREEAYVYTNRRAEMYGLLRERLDPAAETGFALPAHYTRLRHQLSVIPLTFDPEGRLELLPKNKRPGASSTKKSLVEIIGYSPDEADALVLAVYGMLRRQRRAVAGAAV